MFQIVTDRFLSALAVAVFSASCTAMVGCTSTGIPNFGYTALMPSNQGTYANNSASQTGNRRAEAFADPALDRVRQSSVVRAQDTNGFNGGGSFGAPPPNNFSSQNSFVPGGAAPNATQYPQVPPNTVSPSPPAIVQQGQIDSGQSVPFTGPPTGAQFAPQSGPGGPPSTFGGGPGFTVPGQTEVLPPPPPDALGEEFITPGVAGPGAPGYGPGDFGLPPNFADIDAVVQEAQSGRFMIGAGINSDAGVTGQLIIDERNFDIFRVPTSWDDVINGRAFRGGGQGFRLEAIPGDQVQRYLVSWSEPYLFSTPVSLNVSGYYYDRRYTDWDEQRVGGRVGLGYRLTHDLSMSLSTRFEQIDLTNPRVTTSPELNAALGESNLYTGDLTLTHDTRDNPFAATEGHLIELNLTQAFGTFDYPRGEIDYRRYFLVRERPDGSGRHTFSFSSRFGISGSQTPIYENYFAGGFSTLRGFEFRGASPVSGGVRVGGRMRWINSVEYLFPLTADDMMKGIVFCDFGTVEQDIKLSADSFRVAPGFGFRVNIPAFGNGAPLAFDFAFPVAMADTDEERIFSFFMGLLR